MQYKWDSKLTPAERTTYPKDRIIVWYDRVYDEYVTADGTKLDRFFNPIKEQENKG